MADKLTRTHIERLRQSLTERHRELRETIAHALDQQGDERNARLAGAVRDEADEAVAELLVDMDLASIHRELAELQEIDTALGRMREDMYGQCQDCGRDIAVARLEAHPTATRCRECQEAQERWQGRSRATL